MAPLDGIRVVDLTRVLAGPFCTMMLGDMGAEVIKIEDPELGDESRGWAPFVGEWSSYFLGVNRNKKSVALNLKTPEGREHLTHLIADADVLVENFRPGSLARLGLDYAHVKAINPRLIYCSITGYGHTGPRSDQPGYDVVIQGEAGLMSLTGQREGEPTRVGIAITDYLAGLYAHQGILLALLDRQRTGEGQHIDIALFDSLLSVMTLPAGILFATGESPGRMGNEHPSVSPYETLTAADGSVIVAVGNPRLWHQFCDAIGRLDLELDDRFVSNESRLENRPALRSEVERTFQPWTVDQVLERLRQHKVPCGRVRGLKDALADPQVSARGMVVDMPHPELGSTRALGNPVRMSTSRWAVRYPPPRVGEHNDEILAALPESRRK